MKAVRTPKRSSEERTITIDGFRGVYGALGYRSARVAASEGRGYYSYPGSTHDERDRGQLIAQSRDFMRNNAIYKGMIERMVSYIAGNGFELQAGGSSKTAVAKVEKLWKDWFKKPEVRNLLSGAEVSRMIVRELMVAGDTLALKTDKSLIQLFEAEQIDGDKSYPNGIRKNKYGAPDRFHLCPWKSHGIDKKNGRGVQAADVLFLSNPDRPSALRGVPACQAAFAMLHRVNDICDSEAIAWQLLSRLAVAIEREEGPSLAHVESKEDPNISSDDTEGKLSTRMTELGYALMFHAQPGEKITGIERNIPGKNFTESIRMFLRLLGLPIGCPLELVLLDWTQSNYSQSRAVLEQAYENFTGWQKKMIDFFFAPLFQWRLEAWQSAGLIARGAKIEAGWITPTFPWIDQLKEAQAQAAKMDRGFTTHSAVCKSLKTDRDEVIAKRDLEVRDAIERAKKIEADTGEKVPWQIFAGLEPPGKSSTTKDTKEEPAEPDKDKEKDEDD
jgi:lambda family phage portal protein